MKNIIISVLTSSLIVWVSVYALTPREEDPAVLLEKVNRQSVEDCISALDTFSGSSSELQSKISECSKIQLKSIVWTVAPASSGVPERLYSSINSTVTNTNNADNKSTFWHSHTWASSSWSQVLKAEQAERIWVATSDKDRPQILIASSVTQTGGHGPQGQNEATRTPETILDVLSLGNCRITQDEDSHVTLKGGHIYGHDIACEKWQSFVVSAPIWKKEYTVIAVGFDKRLGDYIVLEHKNYRFVFAHTETSLKVGQKVPQGEQIGITNLSGLSTGMHVHFELWRDGYNITHEEMLGRGSRWNDKYSFRLLQQRGWYTGIDDAIDLITSFEGYKSESYEDPKGSGRWSIGYGTYASWPGETITREEAKRRIRQKVIENMDFIYQNRLALSWNERIALSSFFYNLGTARPHMIEALRKRDMVELEKLWKSYINKGSIYEDGLTKRRTIEWSRFIQK